MDIDVSRTIAPRSDQINADDLVAGPVTVTVAAVTSGTAEQPINLVTAEFGEDRPWKPCKTMRRVLVAVWGKNGADYVGGRLTLYCDPNVKFGGMAVGGIRISHMSGIDGPKVFALTTTRGKRGEHRVDPIPSALDGLESRIDAADVEKLPGIVAWIERQPGERPERVAELVQRCRDRIPEPSDPDGGEVVS